MCSHDDWKHCNGIPVRDSTQVERNARLIEINFNYLLNKLWNFERKNNRDDRPYTCVYYYVTVRTVHCIQAILSAQLLTFGSFVYF